MELALNQSKGRKPATVSKAVASANGKEAEPGWAQGLRSLYKAVVDEPLPPSFDDLLKKLDERSDG